MRVGRVLAPNPGLLTGPGTNSWIVWSEGEAIVIDPGPDLDEHVDAIVTALVDSTPVAVLVTHTHLDHAPAANGLAARLGVPAIGPASGPGFSPDRLIADGQSVVFGSTEAVCVATPGHTPESVSYRIDDVLFAGDHIMGGSTVMVEDMIEYMHALHRLRGTGLVTVYPGHGPVIDAPDELFTEYIEHRLEREQEILRSLEHGADTLGGIVLDVYADVNPALHPAAAVSVAAHLRKLVIDGLVRCEDDPGWDSAVEFA